MTRITLSCLALTTMTLASPLHAAPGDVAASFDAPCAYPSGMATDGASFFIADWREAKIFQVSAGDGALMRTIDAPTLKPHGLAFGGGLLWVCDNHTGGVFGLNLDTGVVENTFEAPESGATGLAYADDTLFILTEGKIYTVMPEGGTILGYFDAPESSAGCMTHDGRYLWVSDRTKDELYMVDPDRRKVVGILDAPGPYAAGVAWRDGGLFNVDFQTRKIYELVVHDDGQKFRLTDTRRARVEHLWSLANYGPGDVTDLQVNLAVPMELPSQKLLSEIQYSIEPKRIVTDQWGQQCAVFAFDRVPAASKAVLTYSVEAEVSAFRYLIIPEETGTLADVPSDIRAAYTVDGSRYRLSTPYIQETVKEIVGDEDNPYWIARKIYDFVIDHLEYQMIGGWDVPEVVLKRGSGSCSEYTFSFVSLCRAAGLPARYQGSIVVRGDDASIDKAFHRWAQIYLPGYGWVPVDANRGDKASPADQCRGFGGLANRFLITTQSGGDSQFLHWGYNAYTKFKSTGYCNTQEEHFGFWAPLEEEEPAASTESEAAASAPITGERAIEIAKAHVEGQEWKGYARYEARRNADGWGVMTWREPQVPGGHLLIIVGLDGQVRTVSHGR